MNKTITLLLTLSYFLLLSLMATEQAAAADAVGKVIFALGQPKATDLASRTRDLHKGDPVYSGDRLTTDNGRIQVSFIDGAFISLQPNSEYHIDQFRYSGKQDGTERAIFRLIKGGVRALTGLIGKKNHDAYKVHTPVATIGIRGTGHNTRFCQGDCPGRSDGLYHNTWEGVTYVSNNVDSVDVPAGRGIFLDSIDGKIAILPPGGATALQLPPVDKVPFDELNGSKINDILVFTAGEQQTINGFPLSITNTLAVSTVIHLGKMIIASPDPGGEPDQVDGFLAFNVIGFFDVNNQPVGFLFNTTDTGGVVLENFGTINLDAVLNGDDPFAVAKAGNLLAYVNQTTLDLFQQNPAVLKEFAVFGQVAVARWSGGQILGVDSSGQIATIHTTNGFQSAHFVYGPLPPPLPASGVAFYIFAGGTQSTSVSGATIGSGVINGDITVDFGSSSATINMEILHAGINYFASGALIIDPAGDLTSSVGARIGVSAFTSDPASACAKACPVIILGSFFGTATDPLYPGYIGLKYNIQESDPIMGVATFTFDSSL